jgi:membrane associated rhomboid family serine protease
MRKDFYYVAAFLIAIWLVYVVDAIIPYALNQWGLDPRTVSGLPGIVLMPFLHQGFGHVFGNTLSLAILLVLLLGSRRQHWTIVVAIVVINGVLLWLLGRSGNHVGASGLVFGLIAYLIVAGILEKKPVSIGIALLVGFFFGGTLISGIIPRVSSEVSWDGHLSGAVAGAATAYLMLKPRR